MTQTPSSIAPLLEIMARLRDPDGGCPWDLEQSYRTIAPYTIEEAYEVADAIERGDFDDLKDELGDLLLQVVFHARMAEEDGRFAFGDVVEAICEKMIRRHPHVFGDVSAEHPETVVQNWEAIKAAERAAKNKTTGAPRGTLDDVPPALPALLRAEKLQKRASRVGFDWPSEDGPIAKLEEEVAELKEAAASGDGDKLQEEFGDFLFAAVNVARHLDIDPETALREANAKFKRRFDGVEARLRAHGKAPSEASLTEMDRLWDEVKRDESS